MQDSIFYILRIELPLLLILAGVTVSVFVDPYMGKERRRLLLLSVGLTLLLLIQNYADYALSFFYYPDHVFLRTFVSFTGYAVRPVLIVVLMRMIDLKANLKPAWILTLINALIYTTMFYSEITVWYTEGHFSRGPLGYTCHVVSLILLIAVTVYSLTLYRNERKKEDIFPVVSAAVILLGLALDFIEADNYYLSFLTITITVSCVFYFLWIHLKLVREYEIAMRAEQRIQIMMSQIQPHFLYNTLTTIQALCRIDPEKAFDILGKFGMYLRQNIDSLSETNLIPFEKELYHTRTYADIEMTRFPSISVEYDIQDGEFELPALTVQPLVENAIRHGVRSRKDGVVRVSTYLEGKDHVIVISDNGKGFDVKKAAQNDSSHIGLRNVRERIEKMCGGSFSILSAEGKGTEIMIRIPAV